MAKKVGSTAVVTLALSTKEAQALADYVTRSCLVSMRDAEFRERPEFSVIIEVLGQLRDHGVRARDGV